ncbi:TonB-dependent receptor [Flammeovirgaceae bacterium SG7u.111]|nr:TonB-dependent receptor [Flammeovirgaceae bacterium SG7u.132]WPO37686.1 TonB-dependent receptor [Flammeovirgaceae bacterium SG7u.111]
MKLKLLRQITIMSRNLLFGIIAQAFLCSFLMANDGKAQSEKSSIFEIEIEMYAKNVSLKKALSEIENKTDFSFSYTDRSLNKKKEVSLEGGNKTLAKLLGSISKQTGLKFTRINNNIHISKSALVGKDVELEKVVNEAMQVNIKGKITSGEDNLPLPGVSILIKGTTIGTTSNIDGEYSLNAPTNSVLQFSYIGFLTQEVTVGSQNTINIVLEPDMEQLEEVVVVGYGTQEKVNLTGAVGTAKGEVLQNRPIVNVGQGLQGVIPNLNVNIRNGDPSAGIDFNIRGYESINGGQPLILVDGVPMDLNKLNPNDIESISVLKDAAAAAVYGARAAFGVVLVETKKGKGDKINVSFGAEYALAKPILFIDPVTDPYQFVLARNQATLRTNGNEQYDQDYIDGTKRWSENPTEENRWGVYNGSQLRHYGYNNYVDELITDFAPQQKYDLNISGSSEKASYYVSFGYLNKDGYLKNKDKNENFKRYNFLMKGDYKINKWLALDTRALLTIEKSDKPHFYNWDVNINTSTRQDPLDALYFPDLPYYITPGDREDYEQYIGMGFGGTNFLPYLEEGGRETWTRNDLILTQGITISPLKGLKIKSNISVNLNSRNYQDVQSKLLVVDQTPDLLANNILSNGFSGNDWINNQTNNNQYYVFNAFAEYKLDKFEGHNLSAMVGFNQEWGINQFIRGRAYSLITPQITDLNATTGNQETYGGQSHVAIRGVFYRLNYIFKDKYLFEANGRYDGTSRFPKDDRFGFFPSFSLGWKISNEAFMDWSSAWMNNMKIRASYGTLGNQTIVDNNGNQVYYPYIPSMGIGASAYMMSSGSRTPFVSASGLVSPNLTWETVISKNLGLDFTLFNSRLDVSFDVYTRDTKDMLTGVEYPSILGTDAPDANAADLQTRGWEIAATWRNRINEDWNYAVTLALADNQSKITKYDNPTGALGERYVGQVIGERWGYETVGIFQTEDAVASAPDQSFLGANWRPGDIQYADLDGNGEINSGENTLDDPGDRKIIAYEAPRYTFGINNDLGWKNFSLNVFFQGLLKQDYWPPNGNWVAFYPYNAGHVENYYLTDTWSPENPDAYFAAPHISTNTKQNIEPQTRYVQNGAYIRLKNMTLAYNLPQDISSKVGLVNARIYVSGMNLWEYTKMRKPLDPEVRPTLTQEYYKQRIYSTGVQVTF